MTPEEQRDWSGGWLSGGCADDAPPPTILVFEDRPEGSEEPRVVREGNMVWIDTGSGPGAMAPVPTDFDE